MTPSNPLLSLRTIVLITHFDYSSIFSFYPTSANPLFMGVSLEKQSKEKTSKKAVFESVLSHFSKKSP